jgi:regulator of replication initiation timing
MIESQKKYITDRDYYLQVEESIKSIYNLTARVDERVIALMKKQDDLEYNLNQQLKQNHSMDVRLANLERILSEQLPKLNEIQNNAHELEMEMQSIKVVQGGAENRWQTVVGFVVQIAWVLLAAWLLMKLGIQAPAVP